PPPSFSLSSSLAPRALHSFPTRRSSDLGRWHEEIPRRHARGLRAGFGVQRREPRHRRSARAERMRSPHAARPALLRLASRTQRRSEEHTSELQSRSDLVCRLLLEKKKKK